MTRPTTTTAPVVSGGYYGSRAAMVAPATFRDSDNTVEVIWSTGASVQRQGLFGGAWIETLHMGPGSIRLARLNDGGPLLDSHDMFECAALLGSIVPGSVQITGGQGTARVTLTDAADAADTLTKLREGHLTGISVGYQVHTWEVRDTGDPNVDEYIAVDWEPLEISLVTVPADPGAHVRSGSKDMTRIIDNRGRGNRAQTNDEPPAIRNRAGAAAGTDGGRQDYPTAADDYDGERPASLSRQSRNAAVTVERIRSMCDRANFSRDFERALIDQHADDPMTEAQLLRAVNDELIGSRPDSVNAVDGGISGAGRHADRTDTMRRNFADALYARLTGGEAPEAAREYRHAGLVDFGRALLEARGERVRWMRGAQVVDQLTGFGGHTTSDFAYIIQSAGQRFLIDAFNQTPSPLKVLARKRDFPDFKRRYGVQVEGPPVLRTVPELGEFKRVSVTEAENGAQLSTYGEIFAISRQALINDDLGVFADMARFWARALSETEANLLVAMIDGNGVEMEEDGKSLYHADHGNIAAVAAAPSVVSLSAARQQLRTIKNRDGATPANGLGRPKSSPCGARGRDGKSDQGCCRNRCSGSHCVFRAANLIDDPRAGGSGDGHRRGGYGCGSDVARNRGELGVPGHFFGTGVATERDPQASHATDSRRARLGGLQPSTSHA